MGFKWLNNTSHRKLHKPPAKTVQPHMRPHTPMTGAPATLPPTPPRLPPACVHDPPRLTGAHKRPQAHVRSQAPIKEALLPSACVRSQPAAQHFIKKAPAPTSAHKHSSHPPRRAHMRPHALTRPPRKRPQHFRPQASAHMRPHGSKPRESPRVPTSTHKPMKSAAPATPPTNRAPTSPPKRAPTKPSKSAPKTGAHKRPQAPTMPTNPERATKQKRPQAQQEPTSAQKCPQGPAQQKRPQAPTSPAKSKSAHKPSKSAHKRPSAHKPSKGS